MKKRIIAIVFIISFVFSIPLSSVYAQKPLKGVALGDSVPAFYGVEEQDGYVAQLVELLKAEKIETEFVNLAVNGLSTQTLLEQLTEADILAELENADIITLNIGGNNVLIPFAEIVLDELKALKITDITKASPVVLMAFMGKKLTEKQIESLMENIEMFEEEFPEIIEILNTVAPNAEIFVNTVYNPIPAILGIYAASEILIPYMNEFIIKNSEELGYIVVDIYSIYKDSADSITNFNAARGSVDIHPNVQGHALIAEAVASEIIKVYVNNKTGK